MNHSKINQIFLLFIVFIAGFSGMVIEFAIVRVVSPLYGSSMEIWAIIISVILLALALGYFAGGLFSRKLADSRLFLFGGLLIAGLQISISYFLYQHLVLLMNSSGKYIAMSASIKTLLILVLIYFVPFFLLGSIYPIIVHLLKRDGAGLASGLVFAFSTFGSIFGTLLPAYFLLPTFGLRNTFLFVGAILTLISLVGIEKKLKIVAALGLVGILLLILIQASTRPVLISNKTQDKLLTEGNVIFQKESTYQNIIVKQYDWGYTMSLGDPKFISSYYSRDSIITDRVFDFFSILPLIRNFNNKLDVLIIGLGAGTISRQYNYFYADKYDLYIDGVELDPDVVEVGKKYFEMENPSLNIHVKDGRVFLNNTERKYDIIILDVYTKQSYIPFHLATKEFLEIAKNHLNDNGLIAYNVFDTSSELTRFNTIGNTVKSVFEYTYYFTPRETYNYIVIASDTDFVTYFDFLTERTGSKELEMMIKKLNNQRPKFLKTIDPLYIIQDETAPERI